MLAQDGEVLTSLLSMSLPYHMISVLTLDSHSFGVSFDNMLSLAVYANLFSRSL